eukprot:5426467-Pleurochrysis_carterae.AAC.1
MKPEEGREDALATACVTCSRWGVVCWHRKSSPAVGGGSHSASELSGEGALAASGGCSRDSQSDSVRARCVRLN